MNILVVDDELVPLKAIITGIEADGHHVRAISNPYLAREIIQNEPTSFSLAVIDKNMTPDPSTIPDDEYPEPEDFARLGLGLVHLICQCAPRCPIIFLSAFLDPQDRKELGGLSNVEILDKGGIKLDRMLRLIRRLRPSPF